MSQDRYLRHSLIDWFDQKMILAARVIVVGVGATGNEVLKNLCLLGIGHIHIVDYDRIEPHNLTKAILFTETDIGRHKAEVAAGSCRRIEQSTDVTYSVEDFWKSLSIDHIRSYDALFCCVDNFEARIRLNQLCWIARVDMYNTAIDSRFVTVEKYPFSSSSDSACYQCGLPESVYGKMNERYSCGWLRKRAFEEKKIPTTAVTASIAGAQVCSLYLHRYRGDQSAGAVRCFTDTISLNSTSVGITRSDDCPGCTGLPRETRYFKVKNRKLWDLLGDGSLHEEVTILLSDKVIVDIKCRDCGCHGHPNSIRDLVDNYDDGLLYCDHCCANSNDVSVRDIMTLSELASAYSELRIPVKYLSFRIDESRFVLELED